jgi:serine O-acetyltransferase
MGIISYIKDEIQVVRERDPAIKSNMEVFLYPSFKAILHYRVAHKLYLKKHYFFARWISQRAVRKTGIEIHPGAQIGDGLFIDHGKGVVIGETAVIGNNCTIYHQVTLGGTGRQKHSKRHPTVGDNVLIGAGAKVLGPVTIGNNAMIGAGSVVLDDVPDNSTVTGMKARVIKMDGERVKYDSDVAPSIALEHNKVPDPVAQELAMIEEELEKLRKSSEKSKKDEG